MSKTVRITADVEISPEQGAEWFCRLLSHDQAAFFVAIAYQTKGWKRPADFQWSYIAESLKGQRDACEMILALAAHLEPPK